jgi:hypothetical protein
MPFSPSTPFLGRHQRKPSRRSTPALEPMEGRMVLSHVHPHLPVGAHAAAVHAHPQAAKMPSILNSQFLFQAGTFTDLVQTNAPMKIVKGNEVFHSNVTIQFTAGDPNDPDLPGGLNGEGFLNEKVTIFGPNYGQDGLQFSGIVRYDGQLVLPNGTTMGSPTPDGKDLIYCQAGGGNAPVAAGGAGVGQFKIIKTTGVFKKMTGFGRFFGLIRAGGHYLQALSMPAH